MKKDIIISKHTQHMKLKKRKKLFVSLILDDLLHSKLLNGLEELEIKTKNYQQQLSSTIIDMLGFDGVQKEEVLNYYIGLKNKAKYIDNFKDNDEMKQLAKDIYYELKLQQPLPTEVANH